MNDDDSDEDVLGKNGDFYDELTMTRTKIMILMFVNAT